MRKDHSTKPERIVRILSSIYHERVKGIVLILIAVALVAIVYWPARAAILLSYFSAASTDNAVNLMWGTLSEVNVDGYKILLKKLGQSDSAYQVVGTKIAKGGQDVAASYEFGVTQDMAYGEQYCFRLEEVTSDGIPGEQHDICGFGPGVTPTPKLDPTAAAFAGTLTPIILTQDPGGLPPPTLITPPPQSPLDFPSDTAGDMGATPSPTWTGSPTITLSQFDSPLDAAAAATATMLAQEAGFASPTPTSTQQLSPLSVEDANATANAAAMSDQSQISPLETPSPTFTFEPMMTETMTATPSPTGPGEIALTETAQALAMDAATAMYVVQTATSTPVLDTPTPTLTPLPTVTPTPELGLMSFLSPSTQNMVVMMLCLIFLSATGLGSLGLLIAVLYYRSQNQSRY